MKKFYNIRYADVAKWQTRKVQVLVRVKSHAGSSPVISTNSFKIAISNSNQSNKQAVLMLNA